VKIGFVGNEPAGPVLAKAWAQAGHELVGAAVDSPEAIERVETLLPDLPIAGMAAVAEDADLVLLAVPYSDVEIVCDGLTDLGLFGPKMCWASWANKLGLLGPKNWFISPRKLGLLG
jgi:predicted dinucleotide-binding enzyme